jgi:phage/plasmid-associated DNA primase
VVFAPGKTVPGAYNLFRGFAVAPAPGDWSLYRDHVRQNICNGNEDHFNYLLDWLARNVQDPGGERPGVAVVLKSTNFGTGKGVFTRQYGMLFGPHFQHITQGAQLLGKFNHHLKGCLFCFVDEGVWGGDKQAAGVLKGLITEPTMMIEPKGINAFPVDNHISLVIASNNDWVVPAGFDDRRFLVLDVSPQHKQDTKYFEAIVAQMNAGGRAALLYDLLERKITVDLRTVPRTAALFDQVVNGMSTVQKFWYERLRAGDEKTWPEFVLTVNLYEQYLEFATTCGDRHKMIDKQFGKQIRLMCPSIKRGRPRIGYENPWVYYLPHLSVCRLAFDQAVGIEGEWD